LDITGPRLASANGQRQRSKCFRVSALVLPSKLTKEIREAITFLHSPVNISQSEVDGKRVIIGYRVEELSMSFILWRGV